MRNFRQHHLGLGAEKACTRANALGNQNVTTVKVERNVNRNTLPDYKIIVKRESSEEELHFFRFRSRLHLNVLEFLRFSSCFGPLV